MTKLFSGDVRSTATARQLDPEELVHDVFIQANI